MSLYAIYLDFKFGFSFFCLRVAAAEPGRRSSVSKERARACYRQRADTDNKSSTYGQLRVVSLPDSDVRDVGRSTEAKQAEVKPVCTRTGTLVMPVLLMKTEENKSRITKPRHFQTHQGCVVLKHFSKCHLLNSLCLFVCVITLKSQRALTFKMLFSSVCMQH